MRFLIVTVMVLVITGCASTRFQPSAVNEIPMYGTAEFTDNQSNANATFIQSVLDSGRTKEQGSIDSVKVGFQYLNRGDFSTSMKRFNQGWLLNPDNPEVYFGFGVWYGRQELYEKSIEMFLLGLSKNPNHKAMLHDIGYSYNLLALRYMYVGYERKTTDKTALEKAREYLNQATTNLEKVINLYPDFSDAYMTLAASMQHLGRYDDAVKNAEKARALGDREAEGYISYLKSAKVRLGTS